MILEDNQARVSCNFCGEKYTFSESELELIRRKRRPVQPAEFVGTIVRSHRYSPVAFTNSGV